MNKSIYKKISILALCLIVVWVMGAHQVHADDGGFWGLGTALYDGLMGFVSVLANLIMSWAGAFLYITGVILNISINLTLHIKDFVASTPSIYIVWRSIRDLSGIFIIFTLLYLSFQIILDLRQPSFNDILKNVVVAGILINFSFFATGVLIDASNVVSLALYNAITPGVQLNNDITDLYVPALAEKGITDGGISNVFMNALQIQSIYDPTTLNQNKDDSETPSKNFGKIILIAIAGTTIMMIAGFSFLFAAIAFVIRLVILLFLLAFSPIWFAASVIPQLGTYKSKGWSMLMGQLIFMPVYLILMYMAMQVVVGSKVLFNEGSNMTYTSLNPLNTSSMLPTDFIPLAMNFALIIIMINVPMIGALSVGGIATGKGAAWSNKLKGKMSGFAGRRTLGAAGSRLDKWVGNTHIGNSLIARDIRSGTIGKLANSKFGGARSFEDYKKAQKDVVKKGKEITRGAVLADVLARHKVPADNAAIKDALDKMPDKERQSLDADLLSDKRVAKYLKKGDYEAIKKSDEFTDEDKGKINDARIAALKEATTDAVAGTDTTSIENMVKNMEGSDILKLANKDPGMVTNAYFVSYMNAEQLKHLDNNGLDPAYKARIGDIVRNQLRSTTGPRPGRKHQAEGYVNKNPDSWS